MNTDLDLAGTLLARGTVQRVEDAKGTLVQCLRGALWLTQQGDVRDIVLEAGDEALIERDGTSILSALGDTRYLLLRPQVPLR